MSLPGLLTPSEFDVLADTSLGEASLRLLEGKLDLDTLPGSPQLHPLGDFALERPLGAGGMGEVYVVQRDDAPPVALKVLSRVSPTGLYRFKREFRSLADLEHPNLVHLHELEVTRGGRAFFTMELIRGVPFVDWVRRGVEAGALPELARLEDAMAQLLDGLVALHERGYVHRDLKPSNVLVEDSGRVVILDFGLIAEPEEDAMGITCEGQLLGTPAYMAPEQSLGHRVGPAADTYAVGVMLHECLCGARPPAPRIGAPEGGEAASADPLAQAPAHLRELCASALARDPAKRASAEQLRARFGADGVPQSPSMWRESTRFVGRAAELERLHAAYARAAASREPVVVALLGRSGQGKSRLLRQLRRSLERAGVVALYGRCRERESVPYKGVDALVDELSAHLRRLPARARERLRPHAVDALTGVFPVLGGLWPSETSQALGPVELRNASWAALRELLDELSADAPLALLIDDVQWSDDASIELLDWLLRPPSPRVLLVFASRPELGEARSLQLIEGSARLSPAERIELGPLSPADALSLARTLVAKQGPREHASPIEVDPRAVALRSGGNPFYIRQLAHGGPSLSSSEDLDVFVARRLATLSRSERALLELVAVGGALDESLVLALCPLGSASELQRLRTLGLITGGSPRKLEPVHDRVREVALRELTAPRRTALHGALGWALHARDAPPFEVVEHLNQTLESEADAAKLWEIAALDLEAGQASLRSAAPLLAASCMEAGVRAVELARARDAGAESSARHEALARALLIARARCVSLAEDLERASRLFDAVMDSAASELEYAAIALVRTETATIASRHEEAIQWGLAGLARLGTRLPDKPGPLGVMLAMLQLAWTFRAGGSAGERIDALEPCVDPVERQRVELLMRCVAPAYFTGGALIPLLVGRAAQAGLRCGLTPSLGMSLSLVSMCLSAGQGMYEASSALARRSLELARAPHSTNLSITRIIAHAHALHWTRPYAEGLAGAGSTASVALDEGNLEYATFAVFHRVGYRLAMGRPLGELHEFSLALERFAGETGMGSFSELGRFGARTCEALMGERGLEPFDDRRFVQPFPHAIATLWAIVALIVLDRPRAAFERSESVLGTIEQTLFGSYLVPLFVFYRGLAAAMTLDRASSGRVRLRRALRRSERRLGSWAKVYAGNLGPCADLLAAERARVNGRKGVAQSLYSAAADEAEARGNSLLAALALERLHSLMLAMRCTGLADGLRPRLTQLYEAWGVKAMTPPRDSTCGNPRVCAG